MTKVLKVSCDHCKKEIKVEDFWLIYHNLQTVGHMTFQDVSTNPLIKENQFCNAGCLIEWIISHDIIKNEKDIENKNKLADGVTCPS